jgi:uncharacterized protein YcbK (DUF882 family)
MLFKHYSLAPWDPNRWPNFTPKELSCHCCGEFFLDPAAFDALQELRSALRKSIHLNSAHRCPFHNAKVGGAPLSMHKMKVAFDISVRGHLLNALLGAARMVGFKGFGFYETFLHVDLGKPRQWKTAGGKRTWIGLV